MHERHPLRPRDLCGKNSFVQPAPQFAVRPRRRATSHSCDWPPYVIAVKAARALHSRA